MNTPLPAQTARPCSHGFHAMAKPSGPDCNLDCTYCFYLEKEALYPHEKRHRMNGTTLEAYVQQYIEATPDGQEVVFTWQGGEPTLLGLDFYRSALELQKRYKKGRKIANTFQTNGLLIDEQWCQLFREGDFLIGLSLDGPPDIHDAYRVTPGQHSSHAFVMRALRLLQAHGVRYNVLACVNRKSAQAPLEVYEFLRGAGVEFIQFIPIVERLPDAQDKAIGLTLRSPSGKTLVPARPAQNEVTDWSVRAEDYGLFLNTIFDRWVRRDVGKVNVMNFEWALANFMDRPGASCHHQPTCGRAVVVEHDGDVYACDHYVYPDYRLGNVNSRTFAEMLESPEQEQFGQDKFSTLPQQCRQCKMLKGCWGGCPKHRFISAENGEQGLNYLCKGYYDFFSHTAPYLKAISDLINGGQPASAILNTTLVFVKR